MKKLQTITPFLFANILIVLLSVSLAKTIGIWFAWMPLVVLLTLTFFNLGLFLIAVRNAVKNGRLVFI